MSQRLSGRGASALVVFFVAASIFFYPVIVTLLVALIGLTGRSRERRQLAAVGCAALAWTIMWWAAALFALTALFSTLGRRLDSWEVLLPFLLAVVLVVVAPIVGALVGRHLWRRAEGS